MYSMRFLLAASLTLAGAASGPASATTIDFTSGTYDVVGGAHRYVESGYEFITPVGNHFDTQIGPRPHLVFHEGSSNVVNNLITLTFVGGAFDLISFDLVPDPLHGPTYPNLQNPSMNVSCSDGTNLASPDFATPPAITVAVGCTNVTSVTFDITTTNANPLVFLDNVVVTPEPATAFLLAAGLVALALPRRRSGRTSG